MREVTLSADPLDTNRLLGCGIAYDESLNREWTVVFLSTDGGKSWKPTLDTKRRFQLSWDPACVLGRMGSAFFTTIGLDKHKHFPLGVYRSVDGGTTWMQQEDMPQDMDGESLTVDATQGKFDNRVYITAQASVQYLDGTARDGFVVWHSLDKGATYEGVLKRESDPSHRVAGMGNSVILSDGTLVSLFGYFRNGGKDHPTLGPPSHPEESNALLEAVSTTDGGDSISEAIKVDDLFLVVDPLSTGTPRLAADPGDGPFRDRLYATWADGRDGRSEIRFSYSGDKGKTWSKSVVLDEVPGPAHSNEGPVDFLPTVAVNKAGIVAVTWYDRSENPDGLGWYLRFRASLDGGDTWLPSVRVSEKPSTFSSDKRLETRWDRWDNDGGLSGKKEDVPTPRHVEISLGNRQFFAGDYAGLAPDVGGTFHAFWIDNRTGRAQIWTAPIVVDGKAIRNGNDELALLRDVSSDVKLTVISTEYDRSTGRVMIGMCLKNSSPQVITGPIKLRLVTVRSMIGNPSVANADNQLAGPGAVWDFSSSLKDKSLKPEETSEVKKLIFRLDSPHGLLDGKSIRFQLLDVYARVLAAGTKQ